MVHEAAEKLIAEHEALLAQDKITINLNPANKVDQQIALLLQVREMDVPTCFEVVGDLFDMIDTEPDENKRRELLHLQTQFMSAGEKILGINWA